MKKLLKKFVFTIIFLVFLQWFTYSIFSDYLLVKEIGKKHETAVLDEKYKNYFDEFFIITDLIKDKEQLLDNFPLFIDREIHICTEYKNCKKDKTDNFYEYIVYKDTKNPFKVNRVVEGELAHEFGASWESKYVWVLFRWVFIEKNMTSIS